MGLFRLCSLRHHMDSAWTGWERPWSSESGLPKCCEPEAPRSAQREDTRQDQPPSPKWAALCKEEFAKALQTPSWGASAVWMGLLRVNFGRPTGLGWFCGLEEACWGGGGAGGGASISVENSQEGSLPLSITLP